MKLEKVDIDILHNLLYQYYLNGIRYIDMEILPGNILNVSPSDTNTQTPPIKIEDIT